MNLKFPKHEASLQLVHNDHKCNYERVEERYPDECYGDAWVSPEQKAKAIEAQDVWLLQWYPDTPVGFCVRLAHDLSALLDE